jgi:hypothetical protein
MTLAPINLNKVRKARARADAEATAAANRAKFGRTKAQKQAEAKDAAKAVRELEAHKRD